MITTGGPLLAMWLSLLILFREIRITMANDFTYLNSGRTVL